MCPGFYSAFTCWLGSSPSFYQLFAIIYINFAVILLTRNFANLENLVIYLFHVVRNFHWISADYHNYTGEICNQSKTVYKSYKIVVLNVKEGSVRKFSVIFFWISANYYKICNQSEILKCHWKSFCNSSGSLSTVTITSIKFGNVYKNCKM